MRIHFNYHAIYLFRNNLEQNDSYRTTPSYIEITDKVVINRYQIAVHFLDHFVVNSSSYSNLSSAFLQHKSFTQLKIINYSCDNNEPYSQLLTMNKLGGPDGLHIQLLKNAPNQILTKSPKHF